MKHLYFLFFQFLLGFNCLIGQSLSIKGQVLDKLGNPIEFAIITFSNGNITKYWTNTDSLGYYSAVIDKEFYIVECSHLSFQGKSETIQGNTVINFQMEELINVIPKIEFKTKRGETTNLITNKSIAKFDVDNVIYSSIAINSAFKGGQVALGKYIKAEIDKIEPRYLVNLNGVVKIKFSIQKDGTVENVKLLKGINDYIDDKILLIFRAMPKWQPAILNGEKVTQTKEISIPFTLED